MPAPMLVSLIAAVPLNGVIGRDNELPFRVKDDMKFFVRTTRGHAVITGRKNFDAMGKPLPGRRNIVVTRRSDLMLPGAEVVTDLPSALRLAEAGGETEAFVIGGAEIYALALPYAHVFYRTRLLGEVVGDVVFPAFDESAWNVTELERGAENSDNQFAFVIEKLVRKDAPRPYG